MKSTAGKARSDVLAEIMALSLENRIKLDALESVLVKTDPLIHELYLGEVEKLRRQEARK